MPHVLALVFGGGGPERRGHLGLTDPVGAPGAGPRLDYVRHMALVILLVLTGLLFVAEDDLADGHGGERGAPRAVRRVVPRRVLASVARDVAEVVGLPARLEDDVVHAVRMLYVGKAHNGHTPEFWQRFRRGSASLEARKTRGHKPRRGRARRLVSRAEHAPEERLVAPVGNAQRARRRLAGLARGTGSGRAKCT